MNGQPLFLSGVECAVHFRKARATFNGHCRNTVFRYPNGRSRRHLTEKPLRLFAELITLLSNEGDLVLDPCAGSGTTAEACVQTGRKYLCGDIHADAVRVAQERLSGL